MDVYDVRLGGVGWKMKQKVGSGIGPSIRSRLSSGFLRGEDLELLSRELGLTGAEITQWRDAFLEGGETGLKPRPSKENAEIEKLQSKIGELTMETELLREKIARMEQNRPLARRRSRK